MAQRGCKLLLIPKRRALNSRMAMVRVISGPDTHYGQG